MPFFIMPKISFRYVTNYSPFLESLLEEAAYYLRFIKETRDRNYNNYISQKLQNFINTKQHPKITKKSKILISKNFLKVPRP